MRQSRFANVGSPFIFIQEGLAEKRGEPLNFTLGVDHMHRSRILFALIIESCLVASGVTYGQEDPSKASVGLNYSRIAKDATMAGWEAYDTGNVEAIERLASIMKTLACERDNDKSSCEALKDFENGSAPTFPEGRTALAGSLILGTLVRGDRFSTCLINNTQGSVVASCLMVDAPEGRIQIEPGQSISGTLAELAANPDSGLHADLVDGFERRKFYQLEYSQRQANYYFPGGYRSNRKIPIVLRWHKDRLYAATIFFVNRRGSFDSYPTLSLSIMRMPSAK